METIPTIPGQLGERVLPTFLETLYGETLGTQKDIREARQQADENIYNDAFNQWSNKKITDLRFTQIIDELGKNADIEIDKKKWEQTLSNAKTQIHTNNLEMMKNKIDIESLKEGIDGRKIYNQYSDLAHLAAGLNLPELSAKYQLDAQTWLANLIAAEKAAAKEAAAEARQAFYDEFSKKQSDFWSIDEEDESVDTTSIKDNLTSPYGMTLKTGKEIKFNF